MDTLQGHMSQDIRCVHAFAICNPNQSLLQTMPFEVTTHAFTIIQTSTVYKHAINIKTYTIIYIYKQKRYIH